MVIPSPGLSFVLAAVLLSALSACGDDAPPRPEGPESMMAGPFAGVFELSAETRLNLPQAEESLAPNTVARFYWYAPEAAGASLRFEVRAEATALVQGTVIHREERPVPVGQTYGFFNVDPRELSEGGGRRVGGHFEWLAGLYSIRCTLGTEEVGTVIFEVR